MKSFEDICKMTQAEVKEYMNSYLVSKKYEPINEDGFLYAKGTEPVLLIAHMDTVHKEQCKSIINVKGRYSSPQGIGGDDRCGIFIIMNLVKEFHCSVLLCEDEEKGGIGASKFTRAKYTVKDENGQPVENKYVENLDVNYMIEFDRKGNNDAVFYSCGNEDFIDFITDITSFKFATGTYSDIATLMPASKLCAVNLSSGYYNAHTTYEYVVYDEMMDTVEAARTLIKEECTEPFKFVAKKYESPKKFTYNPHSYTDMKKHFDGYEYYSNFLDTPPMSLYEDEQLANIAKNDKELELEVIVYGQAYEEETICVYGETKAECWMNLFLDNPNICFNSIVDYTWG